MTLEVVYLEERLRFDGWGFLSEIGSFGSVSSGFVERRRERGGDFIAGSEGKKSPVGLRKGPTTMTC